MVCSFFAVLSYWIVLQQLKLEVLIIFVPVGVKLRIYPKTPLDAFCFLELQ